MLRILFILLAGILASCSKDQVQSSPKAEYLPLTSIFNDSKYSGVKVTVSGFLVRKDSPKGLYLYPYEIDAYHDDITKEARVFFVEDKIPTGMEECLNQYVIITGDFYARSKSNGAQISPAISISLLKIGDEKDFSKRCYLSNKFGK